MSPSRTRRPAARDNRTPPVRPGRDDRARGRSLRRGILRLALTAAAAATVVAPGAAIAGSSSGGVGAGGNAAGPATPNRDGCATKQLGRRTLRLGDCGEDVATLNWILKAKDLGAPLHERFDKNTDAAVRAFERKADLSPDGVVDKATTSAIVRSMPRQRATWYGPGFYGKKTACGQVLTRRTKGVAHRKLPCGSRVVVRYKGRYVRTRVIDRGPFANRAKWDLTRATAKQLRFTYTDDVRVAKIAKRAKLRR